MAFNDGVGVEGGGDVALHVDPDRPDALAAGPAADLVPTLLRHFPRVLVACGDTHVVVTPRAG